MVYLSACRSFKDYTPPRVYDQAMSFRDSDIGKHFSTDYIWTFGSSGGSMEHARLMTADWMAAMHVNSYGTGASSANHLVFRPAYWQCVKEKEKRRPIERMKEAARP